MRLEQYKERPANWDVLIKDYDSKTLFHETVWHDHILSIHRKSEMQYFSIHDDCGIVGYFCGLMVRKAIFKIMGSSLTGTGTNYMGPVVNSDIDQGKLIKAIDEVIKQNNIDYIELCNDVLNNEVLKEIDYHLSDGKTHKVNIADNEDGAFNNLKSVCRNRIRKGIKNGLKAEITSSREIVDIFYQQYIEVYGKQGRSLPFGIKRVNGLYDCLYPSGRLLTVWVKKGETVVASGLFPFDDNAIYFWGAASWLKYHKFCPNELLHWEVIKFAVKNGIKEYNMCGGHSQFKDKFGGSDVPHVKFVKTNSRLFDLLKFLYKKWYFLKQRLTYLARF